MSARSYSLDELNSGSQTWTPSRPFSAGQVNLGFDYCQLVSGRSRGVEMVTLRCGEMRVDFLPTRGMGIWRAEYQGTRFGWDSPVAGPVHPSWVPLMDPGGLGWLEGFDELMVRCGMTSNGAPDFDGRGQLLYPLHGRVANLPASRVVVALDPDAGFIQISGTVSESRFHFTRLRLETIVRLDRQNARIEVADWVTNDSERAVSIQMLYHNNFGSPLLGPGSRMLAPVTRMAPRDRVTCARAGDWNRFGPPDPACQEEVYFMELAPDDQQRSLALLVDESGDCGVSVDFDATTLPCFTLWKNTVAAADGYVAGLEPGTNFPNTRSFEAGQGRVVPLLARECIAFSVHLEMHVGQRCVADAVQRVRELAPVKPEIVDGPSIGWSPSA
jgi:hypothetical protein